MGLLARPVNLLDPVNAVTKDAGTCSATSIPSTAVLHGSRAARAWPLLRRLERNRQPLIAAIAVWGIRRKG